MNKFFIFILCLCCALTVAQATGEDRLNDSDANVFGHVLDKKEPSPTLPDTTS